MMKKMLLLALLPACPAFAQEIQIHEEETSLPVLSALSQELKDTRQLLALPGSTGAATTPLRFSATRDQELLQVSRDFHNPEELLRAQTSPGNSGQEVTSQHFTKASLNLEGVIYNQLDCYLVRDQYQIAPGNELPGNFIYDNTYLVYKDASGATVAEIIYVQCSIGNATTEKKIIRKGKPALTASTLTIAPNPAQKNINISFRTEEKASQVLNISTPEGKVVKTLIDQQVLDAGIHAFDYTLDLAPGFYIVSLHSGKALPVSQKLIIQ